MKISEQLKKKRIELQLSQEMAADKAGISRRTLAYYESGERIPNAENLLALCDLYGLNVNELISSEINEHRAAVSTPQEKIETVDKIDEYLRITRANRRTIKKTILLISGVFTIFVFSTCIFLTLLKFMLMETCGYSFGEATAEMWTTLFNALISFVNNPKVVKVPIVTLVVCVPILLAWIGYFIYVLVKRNRKK